MTDDDWAGPEFMREEIAELREIVAEAWAAPGLRGWIVWLIASAVLLGSRIRLWLLDNGWLHQEWRRNIPANAIIGAVILAVTVGLGWMIVAALRAGWPL